MGTEGRFRILRAVEAIMTEAPGRNVDEPSAPVFSEAESSRG